MQRILEVGGAPKATTKVTCSDTAAALTDAMLYKDGDSTNNDSSNKAVFAVVSVETYQLRYAFATTPTIAGVGHIAYPGDVIILNSWEQINTFKYINHTSGSNAVFQISTYF